MTQFDPDFAEIRFGCGLSPRVAPVPSVDAMLERLHEGDQIASTYPIESFHTFRQRMVEINKWRKIRRDNRGTELAANARKQRKILNKIAREDKAKWFGQTLLRRSYTQSGFFERLAFFWGDHFSAQGKQGLVRRATGPYIEGAIRPHVTGRFGDMLQAAVTHPLMLHYLDQAKSMGPNSAKAIKKGKKFGGLNENLAREVLELHTLGVGGPYTQTDVRELAKLFTGLSFQARVGFKFRKDFTEPGVETVLGKTYSASPHVRTVRAVLNDLAAHPVTAAHIARKLAVHFVSDTPDQGLIDHMTQAYINTDGQLMAVYTAMLEHPMAWSREVMNFKFPVDFVGSACRALAVSPTILQGFSEKAMKNALMTPMAMMGQNWQKPAGPDGWPEDDTEWITPQGLSGRVRWAMAAPQILQPDLPDPRAFVDVALGSFATEKIRFAAASAESKTEAIGLILSAPAFQRR